MKIIKKLKIFSGFMLAVLLLAVFFSVWFYREGIRAEQNEALVEEMLAVLFEKTMLRDDYLLHETERTEKQYLVQSDRFLILLEQAETRMGKEQSYGEVLRKIRGDAVDERTIFRQLVRTRGDKTLFKRGYSFLLDGERRLTGQLLVRAYDLHVHAVKLRARVHDDAMAASRQTDYCMAFSLGIVILFCIGKMVFLINFLSGRLAVLQEGVRIIGTGHLDHRIPVKGDDELSELARGANEMAEKLRNSHISVVELEKEVAQRRQAEESLQEATSLMEMMFDSSPLAIIVIDNDDRVKLWNQAAEHVFGWSRDEVLGRPIPIVPDDKKDEFENVRARLARHESIRIERTRRRTKGGAVIDVSLSVAPFTDAAGAVIGRIGILADITEHLQAEEALRESEKRWQFALEGAGAGVWDRDALTDRVFFSKQWKAMLGYAGEDIGNTLSEWDSRVHPDDKAAVYDALNRHFRRETEIYESEHRVRCKDGAYKWILDRGKVIAWTEDGRPRRVIGMHTDITARKETEEEIRRLNEELEQRVWNRTVLLEAANKELEAFSYSVSHDLRAPLRSIDGFSQALTEDYADRPLDETGRRYLARIRKATHLMGHLIDDLLKLSRVTRSDINREPVDLSRMAEAIFHQLQQDHPDRQVEGVVQDNVMAMGDYYLLDIAMRHLFDNAWKFTGKADHPRIAFGTVEKDGATVYFLRDNGVGFDMAYADKLFGPFQRLHTPEEFPGTGIGLATVKRIIARHGGEVWAEGEIGRGATFYFTLP